MNSLKKNFLRTGYLLAVCIFFLTPVAANTATGTKVQSLLQDADAVNLKIEKHYTINADGSYKLNLYIRRRILTYKGKKEYADFKLNYNQARQQVKLLKAQTTTVKGEVLTVKPEEVHDIPAPRNSEVSLYSKSRQMVVSLPAVEPGSEIELELELQSKNGFWCQENFRLNDPIIDKTVTIDAPASLNLRFRAPHSLKLLKQQGKTGSDTIRYKWRKKNIPALTPERGAAPLLEQGFSLLVSTFSNWQQVTDLFKQSFINAKNLNNNIIPSSKLDNSDADDDPISHQLYRQIRKLTTYEISFQETNWKIQSPAETRRLSYGTDCDLALLFATQLKLHRQPADLVMVCSQNHFLKKFADFPYPGWWDTAIVKSGTDFFLFSSEKTAPGITGYDDRIGLDLESGEIIVVKDRTANKITTKLDMNLQDFPNCRGEYTLHLYGRTASEWRSQWRDISAPEREIAANQFLHQIDPEAEFIKKLSITGLNDDRKNLTFKCKYILDNSDINISKDSLKPQYLLPLKAPELPFQLKSMLTDRKQPLTISNNLIISNQIAIQLPDRGTVIAMPPTTAGNLPGFSWQVTSNFDPKNRTFNFSRTITLQRGIIQTDTPDYQNLVSIIRLLYQPDSLRVIFLVR